jgi:hypothetical protein
MVATEFSEQGTGGWSWILSARSPYSRPAARCDHLATTRDGGRRLSAKWMTVMSQRTAAPTIRFAAAPYTIGKSTILRCPSKPA